MASGRGDRIGEGQQLMKEGEKLEKGGWFSSSDPEQALRKYEKAQKKFRGIIPQTEESLGCLVNCLEKSGHLNEKLGYHNFAGNAFDEGARALERNNTDPGRSVALWQQASMSFRVSTQHDKSASVLLKAANLAGGEQQIDLACQACDILMEEERVATCRDHFRQAVDICIKQDNFQIALELLDKQIQLLSLKHSTFGALIYQIQLAIIVIHLYQRNRELAWDTLQKFCLNSEFGASDQCNFAARLLKFANEVSEPSLPSSLLSDFGIYLVGEVSRLGRKINLRGLEPVNMTDQVLDQMNEGPDLDVDLDGDDGPNFM